MPTTRLLLCLFLLGFTAAVSARADEKLAGKACRSVHLGYPAPAGRAFYIEVTPEQSAPGTYFCACGFNGGYFGIQEQSRGKKVAIFSVWDPGKQDDPNAVAEGDRVKLVYKDEAVRVGRFGGEGTGGQSFLDLDWKLGETYRFLVTSNRDGDRTEYAGHLFDPAHGKWRHLVTFSTLTKRADLGGYYSFVEDFRRDGDSLTRTRTARFGNGWIRTPKGEWHELMTAKFTADGNPALNIDAGLREGAHFLSTGGEITNEGMKLGEKLDRPAKGTPPAGLPLPEAAPQPATP